jgi:cytoskeletal protein CcmA (bactofilin family)
VDLLVFSRSTSLYFALNENPSVNRKEKTNMNTTLKKENTMSPRNKQPIRWTLVLGLALTLVLGLASVALAADFRAGDTITIGKDEVIDDDLIITGQNVIVDGTINGDLVVTGGTIVINGTVNGSLLTAGQSMTINGTVGGSLYGAGASLTLGPQAVIARNLFFGGYSLTTTAGSLVKRDGAMGGYQAILNGEIQRDLRAGLGALALDGIVGRNAYVDVGEPSTTVQPDFLRSFSNTELPATIQPGLRIGAAAQIAGKLNYTSPIEQTSGIVAQPQGGVTYSAPVPNATGSTATAITVQPQNPVVSWLWSRLRELVTLLVIGGLALWLLPKRFQRVVEQVQTAPVPSTAWGFAVLILGYLAAFLAMALLIVLIFGLGRLTLAGLAWGAFWGGTAGLSAFFAFFTLLVAYGSKVVVAYPIGRWLLQRFQGDAAVAPVGWQRSWPLLVGVLLYVLVVGIPYLSFVVSVVVTLLGLGAMWLSLRSYTPKVVAPTLVLQPA